MKEWTGERLETFIYNETTIEHLHRYALACDMFKNLDVLDIASGEGYGSYLLSLVAKKVIGVDISRDAVVAAKKKYLKDNLKYLEGSASAIPLKDQTVDAVISFETIEHHDEHQEMIDEIKRVLKPGGILLMSSPDKKYYSDVPGYNNPFHVKELYSEDFKELIRANFHFSFFMSQKVISGSLILPEKSFGGFCEYSGDYQKLQNNGDFTPVYNLCVASGTELDEILKGSFFDGKTITDTMIKMMVSNAADNAAKITEDRYKKSWAFKIGDFLISPLKYFKNVLKPV